MGQTHNLPNDTIEQPNAKRIPLRGNPTPYLEESIMVKDVLIRLAHSGFAIDFASCLRLNKYINKCRDEGSPVTSQQIFPVHGSKLFDGIFMKEDQIDVESHAERPEAIDS